MARDRDLPSMSVALAHSIRFAYRAEPKLLLVTFVLVVASWIPDAFGALWLKLLADGAVGGDSRRVAWAAAGLAASGAAAWLLRIAGDRVHFLFRERATIAIEAHVAKLQASVASIEHHEREGDEQQLRLGPVGEPDRVREGRGRRRQIAITRHRRPVSARRRSALPGARTCGDSGRSSPSARRASRIRRPCRARGRRSGRRGGRSRSGATPG